MCSSLRSVALLPFALLATVAICDDGFVTSGDVRLHYVQRGAGVTVILLHGRGGDIGTWIDSGVLNGLASHYRVVALDLRGFGKSGKPHDSKQYGRHMGLDVIRLLDHLRVRQAHIVGYSLGAMIVSQLLTSHEDRFLTATLAAHGGLLAWTSEDAERQEQEASEFERYGVIPSAIRRLAPPNAIPSDAEIKKRSEAALANPDLDRRAIAAMMRSAREQLITADQAAAVRVPTLAIVGGLDPLRASVQALKAIRPAVEVVIVENATHGGELGVIRRPEFVSALRAFLDAHSPASRAQ